MPNQMNQSPASYILNCDVLDGLDLIPDRSIDLIVTSPPYNIGKPYERDVPRDLKAYLKWCEKIITKLSKKIKKSGSICWQVGNCVAEKEVIPLDIYVYPIFKKKNFYLRNRIIWQFNFGLNARQRLSGRYETMLWFSSSQQYKFNLDSIRVPQLYPGKRHSSKKNGKSGELSGNPLGKNPSDYWEFNRSQAFAGDPVWHLPNVKSNHPEHTIHPCQFPVELAERCVLAFTYENDIILDPFLGTGSTSIAALKHGRCCIGIDRSEEYAELARQRIEAFRLGTLSVRPSGKPVTKPNPRDRVATTPDEWQAMS